MLIFILGEDISFKGWSGIFLILAGVVFISLKSGIKKSDFKTLKYALLVGLSIVLYSVNDKVGVAFADPLVYINFKDLIAISFNKSFFFLNREKGQ